MPTNSAADDPGFHRLVTAFESERFHEAWAIARGLTLQCPEEAFFWRALGTALLQLNLTSEAITPIERALVIDGSDHEAWTIRAIVLQSLGDSARVAESYARGIALAVQSSGAYYNRGVTLAGFGVHADALQSFSRALMLDPTDVKGWVAFGSALRAMSRDEESLLAWEKALCLSPESVDALGNLGVVCRATERLTTAIQCHTRALCSNKMASQQYSNLGMCLAESGDSKAAFVALTCAIVIAPDQADLINNFAVTLRSERLLVESLHQINRSILLKPYRPEFKNNKGAALRDLGQYEPSRHDYEWAICLRPDFVEALTNLGTAYMETRQVEVAVKWFERAHAADSENRSAVWNASLGCLAIGSFEKGWVLHENRFAAGAVRDPRVRSLPNFDALFNTGSRVLVCAEQGVGDELMFGSMLADFEHLVDGLTVQVERRLLPLFARSLPSSISLIPSGEPVDVRGFDAQLAAGSLGLYVRRFGSDFVGRNTGYLRADPQRISTYRQVLSACASVPVVGISWRTSNPESASRRNIDLAELCSALQELFPEIRLVNLQYGDCRAESGRALDLTGVELWQCPGLDLTDDLDGVAALICACDTVLTIGNSVAHLCGAVGKPACVLLPYAPSWRWMTEGRSTPWYSGLELFRKASPEAPWSAVIEEASRGIAVLCGVSVRQMGQLS